MVTEHLDMLQADRLRNWARNIRACGADISLWGSPTFVADEAERIAEGIELGIKESPLMDAELEPDEN